MRFSASLFCMFYDSIEFVSIIPVPLPTGRLRARWTANTTSESCTLYHVWSRTREGCNSNDLCLSFFLYAFGWHLVPSHALACVSLSRSSPVFLFLLTHSALLISTWNQTAFLFSSFCICPFRSSHLVCSPWMGRRGAAGRRGVFYRTG